MIEFILMILAIILFLVFFLFGLLTQITLLIIKDARERNYKIKDFFFGIAFSIDVLGNVVCGDLFNILMLKHNKNYYKFGKRGETISSVFGKNVKNNWEFVYKKLWKNSITLRYKYCNNLTRLGNILYNTLDFLDNNHCIKSIQKLD